MNCLKQNFRFTLACISIFVCVSFSTANAQQDASSNRMKIRQLEQEVFGRRMGEDDLLNQLEVLANRKGARRRQPIADELIKNAQGWQAEIASFADRSRDIELRELCAKIVEQLDSNWRETEPGKEWLGLVDLHSHTLFGDAWKRLEDEPTDLAAAAMVLSASPENAWNYIAQHVKANFNGSGVPSLIEVARTKYLLLRIRELSPDSFAAKRLQKAIFWKDTARAIFPANTVKGPAWRTVGHVILKRFETKQPLFGFRENNDQMFFRLHLKQFQIFECGQPNRTSKTSFLGAQLLGFKSIDYGPYPYSSPYSRVRPNQKRTSQNKARLHKPTATPRSKVESQFVRVFSRIPFVPAVDVSGQLDRTRYNTTNIQPWVKMPWWWERYVSPEVADGLRFASRKRDEVDPAELSDGTPVGIAPTGKTSEALPADLDSAAFVILEPEVIRRSKQDVAAAEIACERIREELQNQSVQVVDRTMLRAIIEERQRNETTAPITSFDTMVRLRVINNRRDVFSVLSMVDLSTGSVIGRQRLVWPIPEKDIPRIQATIKKCISRVKQSRRSEVRIRLIEGRSPNNRQFRFLSEEAFESLANKLRENRSIELVEHYEAESAAEESFLLMAGLSQMPGSREFQPAADATVRFTLEESGDFGKSLSKSSISLNLEANDGTESKVKFSGAAGELDSKLLPQAYRWLTQKAPSFKSKRRRGDEATAMLEAQAKSELDSIRSINPSKSAVDRAFERQQKALAALKLEPTSVDASYELVLAHGMFLDNCRRDDSRRNGIYIDAMRRAISIHEKIKTDRTRFIRFRDAVFAAAKVRRRTELSKQEKQDFQLVVLDLIERDLSGPIDSVSRHTPKLLESAIDDLRSYPYPNEELKSRLAKIVDDVQRLEKDRQRWIRSFSDPTSFQAKQGRIQLDDLIKQLRRKTIACCSQLQMTNEFDELLEIVIEDLGPADDVPFRLLRSDLYAIGDKARKEKVKRLIEEAMEKRDEFKQARLAKRRENDRPTQTTNLVEWTWPMIEVYKSSEAVRVGTDALDIRLPANARPRSTLSPLARTQSGMFILVSDARKAGFGTFNSHYHDAESSSLRKSIGFVPLDQDNNRNGDTTWFKLPDEMLPLKIQGAAASKTHLLVATNGVYGSKDRGLYLLDLKTNAWKFFGADSGLPVQLISGIHSLSGNRVLCTGSFREPGPRIVESWFVFDMNALEPLDYTAAVNAPSLNGTNFSRKFHCVWEVNGIVGGINEWRVWQNLLSKSPTSVLPTGPRDVNPEQRYYQNVYSASVHQSSLFFLSRTGLHRIDNGIDVARSWKITVPSKPSLPFGGTPSMGSSAGPSPLNQRNFAAHLAAPSELPISKRCELVSCGKLLLMVEENGSNIVGYDSAKDTWYGPVQTERNHFAFADGDHIWLGGAKIRRLNAQELIRAATKSGRVLTSEEFKKRQLDLVNEKSLLDRAKYAFVNEDFQKTSELLDQITGDDPENSEAWMLKGFLFDTFALNKPRTSAKAYRMAEKLQNSQSGKFTAAWLRLRMLQRARLLEDAAKSAKEILETYPRIKTIRQQELRSLANQVSD
jgi:hypothetical protein